MDGDKTVVSNGNAQATPTAIMFQNAYKLMLSVSRADEQLTPLLARRRSIVKQLRDLKSAFDAEFERVAGHDDAPSSLPDDNEPRESVPQVPVIARMNDLMQDLHRDDDQILTLLSQRMSVVQQLEAVRSRVNEEIDKVLGSGPEIPPKLLREIRENASTVAPRAVAAR